MNADDPVNVLSSSLINDVKFLPVVKYELAGPFAMFEAIAQYIIM
jgi:hypothetical protein